MVDITQYRKLKIKQHDPHRKKTGKQFQPQKYLSPLKIGTG